MSYATANLLIFAFIFVFVLIAIVAIVVHVVGRRPRRPHLCRRHAAISMLFSLDFVRIRLAATSDLTARRDVIIIASVSCIFGLGSPNEYKAAVLTLRKGEEIDRQEFLAILADLQTNIEAAVG